MTAWDIGSPCWWPHFPVGQDYKVTMSVHCPKLVKKILQGHKTPATKLFHNRDHNIIKILQYYATVLLTQGVCLLLFYIIATVFQLYFGSDIMYEMRKRKPEPILVPP